MPLSPSRFSLSPSLPPLSLSLSLSLSLLSLSLFGLPLCVFSFSVSASLCVSQLSMSSVFLSPSLSVPHSLPGSDLKRGIVRQPDVTTLCNLYMSTIQLGIYICGYVSCLFRLVRIEGESEREPGRERERDK